MRDFLEDYGGWMAFVIALVATLGSLYYSEIAGFIPCRLCWYQRILMYPLAIIALIGSIKRDDFLPYYVLPFSILGIGVSGYHWLLEQGVFPPSASCAVDVPCNITYVNYLGFISIAFQALVAFTLITVIMIGMWLAIRRSEAEQLPISSSEMYAN